MSPIFGFASCLVILVISNAASGRQFARYESEYEDEVERELDLLKRRELIQCKQKFEACSGFPKCCGSLHCYWEDGYSPLRSGQCIECIDRGQKCQVTDQCCVPTVCHRANAYHVNGVCDILRPLMGECHKDSQCESNFCDIGWPERIKGEGGKCKVRQSRRLYKYGEEDEEEAGK